MVLRVLARLRQRPLIAHLGAIAAAFSGWVTLAQESTPHTTASSGSPRSLPRTVSRGEPSTPISADQLSLWVESLGDDSFHTRQNAARRLLAGVTVSQPHCPSSCAVIEALQAGLSHPSLEVRMASQRTLKSIDQAIFDYQIDQLRNPHVDPQSIALVGWDRFAQLAGCDAPARALFARMAIRYPQVVAHLASERGGVTGETAARLAGLDPHRLSPGDASGWALLLSLAASSPQPGNVNLSAAITVSLSSSALGPAIDSRNDALVIRRLINGWLRTHADNVTRETLLIAMRYQCHDQARELCERVIVDPAALPSCQAIALLCAAVLQRPDLEQVLINRLSDQRTAHVWQLIASRRTRIRTQVRDVALALLLRHHQIDPREVGFDELQAHPFLVFREHSLGFANEEARQQAYHKAARRLSDLSGRVIP
jgi:hypothetical protein